MMSSKYVKILMSAVAIATSFGGDCLLAQEYTVTPIGTLGSSSQANKINDRGQVTGFASTQATQFNAIFWSQETGLIALGEVPGLVSNVGNSINNAGKIAGNAGAPSEDATALTWTQQDGFMLLPPVAVNVRTSQGTGINDAGQVVGFANLLDDSQVAFLFDEDQTVNLGIPAGASESRSDSINNVGQVLVSSATEGDAYIWQDGIFELLPTLGGRSRGLAINDLGNVAGISREDGGLPRATVWVDGQIRNLGVLDPDDEFSVSLAFGSNNRGTVVGESTPGGEFICIEGCPDGIIEINGLLPSNVALIDIFDVNNAGQIAGIASIDGGPSQGVVLTPIDPHPVVINPLPGDAGTTNILDLLHFNPNAEVTLLRADAIGSSAATGCPDIDLDLDHPQTVGTVTVDGDGRGAFNLLIPDSETGQTVFFQVVDFNACEATALMAHQFGGLDAIFSDGFESGNTTAWSQTTGGH